MFPAESNTPSLPFVHEREDEVKAGLSEIFHHRDCGILIAGFQIEISRYEIETEDIELDPPCAFFPGGSLELPHGFFSVTLTPLILIDEYVPEVCPLHGYVPDLLPYGSDRILTVYDVHYVMPLRRETIWNEFPGLLLRFRQRKVQVIIILVFFFESDFNLRAWKGQQHSVSGPCRFLGILSFIHSVITYFVYFKYNYALF